MCPDMILLAAGNSTRFTENKLLTSIRGKTLVEHALDTGRELKQQGRIRSLIIVTQYDRVQDLAADYIVIRNSRPDLGISHSIALGIGALPKDSTGCILAVSDQPNLTAEDLQRLIDAWEKGGRGLAAFFAEGILQNPALFSADYYPELCALKGDKGGRRVLMAHKEQVIPVPIDPEHLKDIDTKQDLQETLFSSHTPLFAYLQEKNIHRASFIGGGGKTSTIFALAKEAAKAGIPVTVTTTTHMRREPGMEKRGDLLVRDQDGVLFVGAPDPDNDRKITRPDPFPEEKEGLLLVEADGSRGLPLKVMRSFEPALPDPSGLVVGLVGMSALGKKKKDCCFNCPEGEREQVVGTKELADTARSYHADLVVLNQCDTKEDIKAAKAVRNALLVPVFFAHKGVTF